MLTCYYYKFLRLFHLISKQKYKEKTAKYTRQYRIIVKSGLFDARYYLTEHPEISQSGMDAAEHYLCEGYKKGFNPSRSFDGNLYLEMYPDVKAAGVNPLLHWLCYGKKEKRLSPVINSKNKYFKNLQNNGKYDILLLSHELSLTGAPMALLNLALALKEQKRRVLILSPLPGDMEKELRRVKIDYVVDRYLIYKLLSGNEAVKNFFASFGILFFNTVGTLRYARYISSANRKICWIHEGLHGYDWAKNSYDVAASFDRMNEVYSVGEYSKSFTDKYCTASKSKILLYGISDCRLPAKTDDGKISFGIFGSCCVRKGQDVFVDAVKKLPPEIRRRCRFKIVGKMQNDDFCRSLRRQTESEDIVFTGQLSHKKLLDEMNQTDVIVCPSQDDPMPIVCTEAALLGKTVICSDKTGTASFIRENINGYVFRTERDDLSQIMTKAFAAREKLPEMGRAWHKVYADNFTEQVFKRNIERIFHE